MLKRMPIALTQGLGWHVDLPNYVMIPGTFEPVTENIVSPDGIAPDALSEDVAALGVTVMVEMPDDELDPETKQVDLRAIARKYAGNAKWDNPQAVAERHGVELPAPKDGAG